MSLLGYEPTIIIQTIVVCLNAVQQLTIAVPQGVHVAIIVTVTVPGALLNRSVVSPTGKV